MSDYKPLDAAVPDLSQTPDLDAGQVATPAEPNQPVPAKRRPGAPKGNTNGKTHGLRIKKRRAIDMRRGHDRRAMQTVRALEAALGENLTPQRALILANVGRRLRDLARIEEFEENQHSIVITRKRAAMPITESKWKLLDSINRDLERVGLERAKGKAKSLDDIHARYGRKDDSGGDDGNGSGGAPAAPAS